MKPSALLLADILRAHNIFLMHHDSSLSALFVRSKRTKFVAVLNRYWDLFLSTWNVMLHGNPVREIYGGINIAASGELGVGVGEEDRGSGEREVLEGLVGRIEGLVDLVVSKFGDAEPDGADSKEKATDETTPWLGTGQEPEAEDGAIFLGTGALSRKSLRDVTHWMEDLYTWGDHAYGVIESPTSLRRARTRKHSKPIDEAPHDSDRGKKDPSDAGAANNADSHDAQPDAGTASEPTPSQAPGVENGPMDKMVSYLKMGYGTYWSLPGSPGTSETESPSSQPKQENGDKPEPSAPSRPTLKGRDSSFDAAGHYLIGLKGEIEEGSSDHGGSQDSDDAEGEYNTRTVLRTVNVELESEAHGRPEATIVKDFVHPASILTQSQVMGNMVPGYNSHDLNKAKKLRVVVYVNRPFIFTFLFQLRTDSLAWDSLYRSLHYQLAPLRKPLLQSTRYRPYRPKTGQSTTSNIFDLVWDPRSLSLRSTIPNIPETYEAPASKENSWSRADALNTHVHLLNVHISTRLRSTDTERTQKTSRGWWVVWTRLLHRPEEMPPNLATIPESASPKEGGGDVATKSTNGSLRRENSGDEPVTTIDREIFLVRRASDHVGLRSENDASAGKLAQGIGVDTRRYIEELLTLL